MITIACYNIKGGVGKTATAVNLSYLAAQSGANTLVWDLDPQGATSFYFRIRPRVKGGTRKLFRRKRELEEVIKATNYPGLDLIPADFSYRNMDLLLERRNRHGKRLKKLIKPLAKEYRYLFLDCAPGISLTSENIFRAAEVLLVPTVPTILSLRTLEQLVKFCDQKEYSHLSVLPFFSMADRRKHMHRAIIESGVKHPGKHLTSIIPYASEVEQMGLKRAPLESYAPASAAARAYRGLWSELLLQFP